MKCLLSKFLVICGWFLFFELLLYLVLAKSKEILSSYFRPIENMPWKPTPLPLVIKATHILRPSNPHCVGSCSNSSPLEQESFLYWRGKHWKHMWGSQSMNSPNWDLKILLYPAFHNSLLALPIRYKYSSTFLLYKLQDIWRKMLWWIWVLRNFKEQKGKQGY